MAGASERGAPSLGILEDMFRKALDAGISPWGPLFPGKPGMWGWGSYTGDSDRRRALVVGLLSARDSMNGTLREGSFTGEPKR